MIRNNVKLLREQKRKCGGRDVTKAHLASKIGVTRSYITRLEKGEICPSLKKAFELARYLGCEIETLFIYEKDKKNPKCT